MKAQAIKIDLHYSWYLKILSNCTQHLKAHAILMNFQISLIVQNYP